MGTRTPSRLTSLWALSLSIPRAEAKVPQPAMGMPESSSRPCRVPSSPLPPWSTGKAMSRGTRDTPSFPSNSRQFSPRLGERTAGVQSAGVCQVSFSSLSTGPA